MEPFTQVKLIKFFPKTGAAPSLHLHAIANFPYAWVTADGNQALQRDAGTGDWTIGLTVRQANDQPRLRVLTPIVHTVTLDAASGFNPDVDSLVVQWCDPYDIVVAQEKMGGGTTISIQESDDDTRPFPVTDRPYLGVR